MGTTQTVIMIVLVILLIYIIIRIIWRKQYTGGIMKADQQQIVPSSDLETSTSSECTYSIWIYVDDLNVNYGNKKTIFYHGDTGTGTSDSGFELYLDEYGNNIVAKSTIINSNDYTYYYDQYVNPVGHPEVKYGSKKNVGTTGKYTDGDNENTIKEQCSSYCNNVNDCIGYNYGQDIGGCLTLIMTDSGSNINISDFLTPQNGNFNNFSGIKTSISKLCKVNRIPTQKWVNIIVSLSSVSVDMYIDGKLSKTCLVNGIPETISGQNVYISPGGIGFSGWNAKFEYWAKYMEPQEVWKIYKTGFEKTFNIGNYKLNMSIYKGDVEKASFTI